MAGIDDINQDQQDRLKNSFRNSPNLNSNIIHTDISDTSIKSAKEAEALKKLQEEIKKTGGEYQSLISALEKLEESFARTFDKAEDGIKNNRKNIREHLNDLKKDVEKVQHGIIGDLTGSLGKLSGLAISAVTKVAEIPVFGPALLAIGAILIGDKLMQDRFDVSANRAAQVMRDFTIPSTNDIENMGTTLKMLNDDWYKSSEEQAKILGTVQYMTRGAFEGAVDGGKALKTFTSEMMSHATATNQTMEELGTRFNNFFQATNMDRGLITTIKAGLSGIDSIAKGSVLGHKAFLSVLNEVNAQYKLFGTEINNSLMLSIRLNSVMSAFKDSVPGGAMGASMIGKMMFSKDAELANDLGMLGFLKGDKETSGFAKILSGSKNYLKEGPGSAFGAYFDKLSERLQGDSLKWWAAQEFVKTGAGAYAAPLAEQFIKIYSSLGGKGSNISMSEISKIAAMSSKEGREAAFTELLKSRGVSDDIIKSTIPALHETAKDQSGAVKNQTPLLEQIKVFIEKILMAVLSTLAELLRMIFIIAVKIYDFMTLLKPAMSMENKLKAWGFDMDMGNAWDRMANNWQRVFEDKEIRKLFSQDQLDAMAKENGVPAQKAKEGIADIIKGESGRGSRGSSSRGGDWESPGGAEDNYMDGLPSTPPTGGQSNMTPRLNDTVSFKKSYPSRGKIVLTLDLNDAAWLMT